VTGLLAILAGILFIKSPQIRSSGSSSSLPLAHSKHRDSTACA